MEKEKIIDEEIVGKYFEQNCGDTLLVLNESIKEEGKSRLFKCQFQKYFFEIFARKDSIKHGFVINPLVEQKEFIEKEWPQKCGDILIILGKILEGEYKGRWKCKFKIHPYEIILDKSDILRGNVINPQIELDDYIGKEFPQKCGDILIPIEKTNKKEKGRKKCSCFLWRCKFKSNGYEVLVTKSQINAGYIKNPFFKEENKILDKEIVGKEFKQNCGDTLLVLNKTNGLLGNKRRFECQFKNHFCKVWAFKGNIIKGGVDNPQIEIDEFTNKVWPQNCGDSLKILKKTNLREDNKKSNKKGDFLWECEFINHPYKILATKNNIKAKRVYNPQLDLDLLMSKEWPQKCGDIVKVLGRSKEIGENALYEIEYQKVKYKDKKSKSQIMNGDCSNSLLIQKEEEEFMSKEYPQVGGETLIIIDIIYSKNKKTGWQDKSYLIGYQKYPYIEKRERGEILSGTCVNPLMVKKEEEEFLSKIWPQKCGDSLRIIKKLKEKIHGETVWEAEFVNYPYKVRKPKYNIKKGEISNPNHPNYYISKEEESLRNYIKEIYQGEIITYFNKYEIDIYLPELKLGFEYNGLVWHEEGNPNNPYGKPIGYHENKKQYFKSLGIEIYYIWDYEWYKDDKHKIISESCKERVKNIIFGENNIFQ